MLCPTCGARNDDHSKFCLGCGGPLQQAVPPQTPPPPVPPMTPTPPNQAPAQTGQPIPPYQPPTPPEKKGHTGLIAVIVILLLLIIAGVGIVFVMLRKNDDKETTTQTTVAEQTTQPQTTAQGENTTVAGQPSQQEILDILSGSDLDDWDGNWDNLTAEQRQSIENYYAALGQGVYFGENGITFNDGDETLQLGGQWPDSPLLKDVPKPAFGTIFSVSMVEDEVTVTFSNWTPQQLTDYIGMVKAAGFTKDVEEVAAMGVSSYQANNGSFMINVAQAMGFYMITVTKL